MTKIDRFDKPYGLETYQGPLEIDFAIEDTYPKGLMTMIVQTYTNATGDKVIVYGLPPGQPYFEIIPQDAFDELKERAKEAEKDGDPNPLKEYADDLTPTPMVSGLVGRVVDPYTIEIEGFASMSRLARELKLKVTGTLILEGKFFSTLEEDPITIWSTKGDLERVLPPEFLRRIVDLTTQKTLPQLDPNTKVALYRFFYIGQSMTFPL